MTEAWNLGIVQLPVHPVVSYIVPVPLFIIVSLMSMYAAHMEFWNFGICCQDFMTFLSDYLCTEKQCRRVEIQI